MYVTGNSLLPNMFPPDEDSQILVEEDDHKPKEQHPQFTKVSHQQEYLGKCGQKNYYCKFLTTNSSIQYYMM